MSRKTAWQGSLDGLCGFYCAAHLLALPYRSDYDAIVDRYFKKALRWAESQNLLTATRVGGKGFGAGHLRKMLDNMPVRHRDRFLTYLIRKGRAVGLPVQRDLRQALENGAVAIVQKKSNAKHWIAIVGLTPTGSFLCYDPSREDDLSGEQKKLSWRKGVLLVPFASAGHN